MERYRSRVPGLVALALLALAGPASADVPLKVMITELVQIGSFDSSSYGDFYARITMNGFPWQTKLRRCIDTEGGPLPFTFFKNFDAAAQCFDENDIYRSHFRLWTTALRADPGPATVKIEILDSDSDADDLAVLLPDGSTSIDLTIDPATGRWSGDVDWPQNCNPDVTGNRAVRVCWQTSFDIDGDGLLDVWERDGINTDNDTSTGPDGVDLDLPAMGADPNHKDLFIELDWMPRTPDLAEDGADPASCLNGVDDDGDGLIDLDDFACTDGAPNDRMLDIWQELYALAPDDSGCWFRKPAILPDDPLDIGFCRVGNPDGEPGVRLWIDTGGLRSPSGQEDGEGDFSCDDGIDNGMDGFTDLDDPDCQAGDDLGGGNRVPFQNVSGLNSRYYDIKRANFDARRELVFRYLLMAPKPLDAVGTSSGSNGTTTLNDTSQNWLADDWVDSEVAIVAGTGNGQKREIVDNNATRLTVSAPWNTVPDATSEYEIDKDFSSRGEFGGNDSLVRGARGSIVCTAGQLMHEVGHNLRLGHGGRDSLQYKPNYISAMNYEHVCGIEGSRQHDFSPPRYPGGRNRGALPDLDESDLGRIVLDLNDDVNEFVWRNADGDEISSPLNASIDWDGLTELDLNGDGQLTLLRGSDDWHRMSFSLTDWGQSANGPVEEVEPQEELTPEEILEVAQDLNTTDLALSMSADADPVEAGGELLYRLEVSNNGTRPAREVEVRDLLPPEVSLVDAGADCELEDGEDLVCAPGELGPEETLELEIRVAVDGVCQAGAPVAEILNQASTDNVFELAGPDLAPDDNSAELSVSVVDTTPPVILCNAPPTIRPSDGADEDDPSNLGATFTATTEDVCDDGTVPIITGYDCFRVKRNGQIVDKKGSCVIEFEDDTVTVVNTGGVRTSIRWTVESTDASGNRAEVECGVEVVR